MGITILGDNGHAAVTHDLIISEGAAVGAHVGKAQEDATLDPMPDGSPMAIGVGSIPVRVAIAAKHARFAFPPLIHASAIVSPSASIGTGVQIMARAVVQAKAQIGPHAIINTGAIVEHGCTVDAFAHIAPGAVLCGDVWVGTRTMIGAGAVVLPGIAVGEDVIVGAGSVVTKDITPGTIVKGTPAR